MPTNTKNQWILRKTAAYGFIPMLARPTIVGRLDTGRYTITNVRFMNVAVLSDATGISEMIAGLDENNPCEIDNFATQLISDSNVPGTQMVYRTLYKL
jgi:hypothetical protein